MDLWKSRPPVPSHSGCGTVVIPTFRDYYKPCPPNGHQKHHACNPPSTHPEQYPFQHPARKFLPPPKKFYSPSESHPEKFIVAGFIRAGVLPGIPYIRERQKQVESPHPGVPIAIGIGVHSRKTKKMEHGIIWEQNREEVPCNGI